MARITKAKQKILGINAPSDQMAAFGSCKTGTPVYTTDIDALQTTAYEQGWQEATDNDYAPYREEMNGVQYGLSRQIAYLQQEGLSEWIDTVTYYKGSVVKVITGDSQVWYQSLVDDNTGNNPTVENSTYWKELKFGGGYRPPLLSCMWADHQLNDIQWLRGDTFSWQSGEVYNAVYNLLLEEYNNTASTNKTEGTVTFKSTPRGFKIADVTQEEAIINLYNNTGVAWYYILDTTNQRFKLPRMKHKYWKDQSTIPVMGNGMTMGITDGTKNKGLTFINTYGYYSYGASNTNVPVGSTVAQQGVGFNTLTAVGLATDSTQSGIVADVSNVNIETGFYLYFYVGDYTQDAIEQTAGLNAELFNEKASVDLSNLSSVGQAILDRKVEVEALLEQNGYAKFTWKEGNKSSILFQWGVSTGTEKERVVNLSTAYTDAGYRISVLPQTSSASTLITGCEYLLKNGSITRTKSSFLMLLSVPANAMFITVGY